MYMYVHVHVHVIYINIHLLLESIWGLHVVMQDNTAIVSALYLHYNLLQISTNNYKSSDVKSASV